MAIGHAQRPPRGGRMGMGASRGSFGGGSRTGSSFGSMGGFAKPAPKPSFSPRPMAAPPSPVNINIGSPGRSFGGGGGGLMGVIVGNAVSAGVGIASAAIVNKMHENSQIKLAEKQAAAVQTAQSNAAAQPSVAAAGFNTAAAQVAAQEVTQNYAAQPAASEYTQTSDIYGNNAASGAGEVPPTNTVTQTASTGGAGKKKKFPWWIIAIAAGVLLIAGAVFGFLYFRNAKHKKEAEQARIEAINSKFDKADEYYNQKKFEKAIETYQAVLDEELADEEIERAYVGIADSYVGLAKEETEKGNYDKAVSDYGKAQDALNNVKEWTIYKSDYEACLKEIESGKKKAEELKESGKEVGSETPGTVVPAPINLQDTGDTLTIYVWNDEWKDFFWKYMPGVTYTKLPDIDGYEKYPLEGKLGNLDVVFKQIPSTDGAYQDALDKAIKQGEDVDIFLVEADYAKRYTVDGVAMPLSNLGITDAELADQYAYTQQIVSSGGVLYGSSWQTCIGGMVYDRAIARQVLGTDDPDAVQAMVSDWDKFEEVAAKMQKAGYRMTPYSEFTYRVFANNVTTPWIVNNSINVDDNIIRWRDMTERMVNSGQTNAGSIWSTYDEFYHHSAFCVFGPAWYIKYCMSYESFDPNKKSIADEGEWGLCEGPESFFWGGTWLVVSANSDNLKTSADVIRTMTLDQTILEKLVENEGQDPNSKQLMAKYANDASFGSPILGGQNPYTIFATAGDKIDVPYQTEYDSFINEVFIDEMNEYFSGNKGYNEAYDNFVARVKYQYPFLN